MASFAPPAPKLTKINPATPKIPQEVDVKGMDPEKLAPENRALDFPKIETDTPHPEVGKSYWNLREDPHNEFTVTKLEADGQVTGHWREGDEMTYSRLEFGRLLLDQKLEEKSKFNTDPPADQFEQAPTPQMSMLDHEKQAGKAALADHRKRHDNERKAGQNSLVDARARDQERDNLERETQENEERKNGVRE